MHLEIRSEGDTVVVTPLETRIDARVANSFRDELARQIEQGNRKLVLNLVRVDFIDSSGVSALVSTLKRLGDTGELKVCSLNRSVRSMFELTRLNRVIPITPPMPAPAAP
jgi:anti-sigma B factor antagonist